MGTKYYKYLIFLFEFFNNFRLNKSYKKKVNLNNFILASIPLWITLKLSKKKKKTEVEYIVILIILNCIVNSNRFKSKIKWKLVYIITIDRSDLHFFVHQINIIFN